MLMPSAQSAATICPQTRMTEIASAGVALWWTILLSLPVHLFTSNLVFLGLQRMAGEHRWVLAAMFTFSVQLIGWKSGSPVLRWLGCVTASLFWAFVSAGICIGSPHWQIYVPVNTGAGVYITAAVSNLYCAAFVLPRYCLPQAYLLHTQGVTSLRTFLTSLGVRHDN